LTRHPLSAKVGTNFSNKRRSPGRYSPDTGHRVLFNYRSTLTRDNVCQYDLLVLKIQLRALYAAVRDRKSVHTSKQQYAGRQLGSREKVPACFANRNLSEIKYWNDLRTQQSIFLVLDFIVHFSHYMFRPSSGGSQTQKISKAVIYSTDPLSRYV
jgi:hypothetical protein